MIKTCIAYIFVYPRRLVLYGLFGILGLLLVVMVVNDKNWRPLKDRQGWEATSNYSQEGAHFAIDRDLKTHWSSFLPMTFGMSFQVDTGRPSAVNGLILHVGKNRQGQPVEWVVKTSIDGEEWRSPVSRKSVRYRSMLVIPFETVRARYVQIIQTSIASSPSPWLIHEVDILQPVVPWQFARSTLLFWILGVMFVIVAVLVFSGENPLLTPPRRGMNTSLAVRKGRIHVLTPVLMILIILAGWILRVYALKSYELSDQEFQYLPALALGKYEAGEWIRAYFTLSETGVSWLTLLFIRWIYGFCESQLAAIRMVPAIFSVCAVFLAVFVWRFFSQDRLALWEAVMVSAFMSLSGFYVFLSRTGDLAVPLLFFLLLYLFAAYSFLYKRGTYVLPVFLAALLLLGFFFHPAMGFVPPGIIIFGGFHLLLCKFSPELLRGHHLQSFRLKHNTVRLAAYTISVLPLYGYWFFFVKQENFRNIISGISLNSFAVDELSRALRFCGTPGMTAWIFWGLVVIGIVQVLFGRSHSEWWFFLQGSLSFLVLLICFPKENSSAISVLVLLLFLLFVRGTLSSISFLCPRISEKQRLFIHVAFFTGLTAYIGLFSLNSLFWGQSGFPYAKDLYAEQTQTKQISELVRHVAQDPNPCKTVVARNKRLVEHYASEYGVTSNFILFSKLQRLATQGIFRTYIFTPFAEATENQIVADFLERYYSVVGKSSRVVLHGLKEQFDNSPQRYISKDLYSSTGHPIADESSSSKIVRLATPDDPVGLLTFGPFCRVCRPGAYTVRFALRSSLDTPDDVVARLEVGAFNQNSLAYRELKGTDFTDPNAYQTFDLAVDFDLSDISAYRMDRLQFFVRFNGKAEVRVDYIELIPESVISNQ